VPVGLSGVFALVGMLACAVLAIWWLTTTKCDAGQVPVPASF
jgi:hypothetical protein